MKKFIRKLIRESLLNEDFLNGNKLYYHGSKYDGLTKDNIIIDYDSEQQFLGPAFYITDDIELAKHYGNFIYEVKITGDFMKVTNPIHIGSLGTFDQYLEYGEYSDENDAFDYYKEIQLEVREEIINAGYDGAYDNNQVAIYFPEKNIISIKLLK